MTESLITIPNTKSFEGLWLNKFCFPKKFQTMEGTSLNIFFALLVAYYDDDNSSVQIQIIFSPSDLYLRMCKLQKNFEKCLCKNILVFSPLKSMSCVTWMHTICITQQSVSSQRTIFAISLDNLQPTLLFITELNFN